MPREFQLLPGETFEQWFKRMEQHRGFSAGN